MVRRCESRLCVAVPIPAPWSSKQAGGKGYAHDSMAAARRARRRVASNSRGRHPVFPTVNPMTGRSSYKPTFFDREGPAGVLRIHAAKYGAVTFGLGLVMFATLGSQKLGLGGWQLILFTLVGAFTLSAGGVWVGFKLGDAAGTVAEQIYMGGKHTPYEDQFSQEQALV